MLQAGLFPNFKGADTLLIWGDDTGIEGLVAGLRGLASGSQSAWMATDANDQPGLTISTTSDGAEQVSNVTVDGEGIQWTCSRDSLAEAVEMVAGLTADASGHHYIEAGSAAAQVMVAKNEYPPSLRV